MKSWMLPAIGATLVGLLAALTPTAAADHLACPDVTPTAEDDGDIRLDWDEVEGADGYVVFKNVALGAPPRFREFNIVARLDADTRTFTDSDTSIGAPQQYVVVATEGDEEVDTTCPEIEVTAVPFFPSALGMAAAGAVALGAFVALRRR